MYQKFYRLEDIPFSLSPDPKYLFRYVLTDEFVRLTEETSTGTHYPATSDRAVVALPIPLPPLAEQRRIVAAGLRTDRPFRLPLPARLLGTVPGLRWVIPTVIGWGVRPARVR